MSLFDIFAADSAVILNEIGRDVSFRSVTVKAVVADPAPSDLLAVGGFSAAGNTQTFKFLRASYAASLPVEGELITFNGIVWAISSVDTRPLSPWVKVETVRWNA